MIIKKTAKSIAFLFIFLASVDAYALTGGIDFHYTDFWGWNTANRKSSNAFSIDQFQATITSAYSRSIRVNPRGTAFNCYISPGGNTCRGTLGKTFPLVSRTQMQFDYWDGTNLLYTYNTDTIADNIYPVAVSASVSGTILSLKSTDNLKLASSVIMINNPNYFMRFLTRSSFSGSEKSETSFFDVSLMNNTTGMWTITAYVDDAAYNQSSRIVLFYSDDMIPPVLEYKRGGIVLTNGSYVDTNDLEIHLSDNRNEGWINAVRYEGITDPGFISILMPVEISPGVFTAQNNANLIPGDQYKVVVYALDLNNNSTRLEMSFTHDAAAPRFTLQHLNGPFTNDMFIRSITELSVLPTDDVTTVTPSISGSIDLQPAPSFTLSGNNYLFNSQSLPNTGVDQLTLRLSLTDKALHTSAQKSFTFYIDGLAPDVIMENTTTNVVINNNGSVKNIDEVQFRTSDAGDSQPQVTNAVINGGPSQINKVLSLVGANTVYDITPMALQDTTLNNPYTITVDTQDSYGNIGTKEFKLHIDNVAPTITLKHKGQAFTDGDEIESVKNLSAIVTDTIDALPVITSARVTGGSQNVDIQLSWNKLNQQYIFNDEMLTPTGPNDLYTLSIDTLDTAGNTQTITNTFKYIPRTVMISGGFTSHVNLPAIANTFTRENGHNAIYSEPLTDSNGSLITGQYDVVAHSRLNSTLTMIINGVQVAPGQRVVIASGYDLTATGGSLDFPIQPDIDGELGTASIELVTNAADAPIMSLTAKTWLPTVDLKSANWDVELILGEISIDAITDAKTECRLTINKNIAENSGNIYTDPICLVEYTALPNTAFAVESPIVGIRGVSEVLGANPINYDVYLYHGATRTLVSQGSKVLNIVPLMLTYEIEQQIGSYFQTIQNIELNLIQTFGTSCTLTMDAQAAILSRTGTSRSCFLEWTQLPDGLTQKTNTAKPAIVGRLNALGQQSIGWRVSVYSSNNTKLTITDGLIAINVVEPPIPALIFTAERNVENVNGKYMVSRAGGRLGNLYVTSPGADLVITVKVNGQDYRTYEYNHRRGDTAYFNQGLYAQPDSLWAESIYTVEASYKDLMTMKAVTDVTSVAIPPASLKINLVPTNYTSTVLNTTAQEVKVVLKDAGTPFSKTELGNWNVYLANYISRDIITPLTPEVEIGNNGESVFNLNMTDKRVNLVAVAKLISPYPNHLKQIISSPITYKIVEGGAIEGQITANKLSGRAPFRTVLMIDYTNYDYNSIGAIDWHVSDDNGVTWNPGNNLYASDRRYYQVYPKGIYHVKAIINNKLSGAIYETPMIEINSYNKPIFNVRGGINSYVGTSSYLYPVFKDPIIEAEAKILFDQQMINVQTFCTSLIWLDCSEGSYLQRAIEWSSNSRAATAYYTTEWSIDDGLTWTSRSTFSLPGSEHPIPERAKVKVRSRSIDAPADDPFAYYTRNASVNFVDKKPIRASISGPRKVEVGKEYTYVGRRRDAYASMFYLEFQQWDLPDGTNIITKDALYTPTPIDEQNGSLVMVYKPGTSMAGDPLTNGYAEYKSTVWQYQWPSIDMDITTRYNYAPSTATLILKLNPTGLPLEDYKVAWQFPPGITVTRDWSDNNRTIEIANPGSYNITATATDSRGNITVVQKNIVLDTMPPYVLSLREYGSVLKRAPYTGTYRASYTGGHRNDRVSSIKYYLNGVAQDVNDVPGNFTMGAGDHTVTVKLISNMGQTATASTTFTVLPNTNPTCTITEYDRGSYFTLVAKCSDTDGAIRGHEWLVDGVLRGTANKITVTKDERINKVIQLRAFDDLGGYSPYLTLQ